MVFVSPLWVQTEVDSFYSAATFVPVVAAPAAALPAAVDPDVLDDRFCSGAWLDALLGVRGRQCFLSVNTPAIGLAVVDRLHLRMIGAETYNDSFDLHVARHFPIAHLENGLPPDAVTNLLDGFAASLVITNL